MQEKVRGLYWKMLAVPHRRPDSKEDNDFNQPLIPPIPAFLNDISVLMMLMQKMTIKPTTNDMGNGRTKDTMITATREIDSQAR